MKNKSKKQEKTWASKVGGRTTIGSGCLWFQKGDVDTEKWKFELKTTEKTYYSLHIDDLIFCLDSAYEVNKKPAFVIQLDNKNCLNNIVIVPLSDCDINIDFTKLKILKIKNKQLKLNQQDIKEDMVVLEHAVRKYLIMSDDFFEGNIL